MIEIWDKQRIRNLTKDEKHQWFDVLNHELEADHEIALDDPQIKEKQADIKMDYLRYLESCPNLDGFHKYYIYRANNKIVCVGRIQVSQHRYYLEGLQTHRDYYQRGYAKALIQAIKTDLEKDHIRSIHSEVRVWNTPSNALHQKLGFVLYDQVQNNNYFELTW